MPTATNPSRDDLKCAGDRAVEWKEFRRNFLYTPNWLAKELECCRRTIVGIEAGKTIHPHPDLLRRFRVLKQKQERVNGQRIAKSPEFSHLLQQGA